MLGAQNINRRSQDEMDGFALQFLMHHAQEGGEFLDSIVTADETGFSPLLNPSNSHCNGPIHILPEPKNSKGLAADFYDSGIQKLVPRLNKCLGNAGDYVEK